MTDEQLSELIRKAVQDALEHLQVNTAATVTGEEPFVKISDIIKLLEVSKVTIFQWIRKKKIPCHRMGTRLYFRKSEVLAAMKTNFSKK